MRLLAICCVLLQAVASPPPTQAIDVTALARTALADMVAGEFERVVERFDEKMRAALPEEKLRATWSAIATQLGAFVAISGEPRIVEKPPVRVVITPVTFANGPANVQVAFDAAGRITGFGVRPPAPTDPGDASYVRRDAFREREMLVDAGGWPLPGTLSVPSGPGSHPAVILVHGSGPADRDAAVGGSKIFRDLAHGLASRGVAVLRYEKRTRAHAAAMGKAAQFTVKEEVLDDAAAAYQLLIRTEGIDRRRVFVLGHSLGGMLAPRLVTALGDGLRGVIVLAGAARPLEDAIVAQSRYLAQADGIVSTEEDQQLKTVDAFAARVRSLAPGDPPVSGAGFSAPVSYFLDLRGYDPPAAAKAVRQPMLILQGGRDYQVTTDEFTRWKTALAGRDDVTATLYPELNHLFIAGKGPSLPAEYSTPGHVAEEVVRDIAAWVLAL